MSDQNSDPYEAVLADLRAQRDQIDQMITSLERLRSMKAGGQALGNLTTPTPAQNSAVATSVESGAFFGMTIPDAVKKLLQIKKKNLTNPELIEGLEAGGMVMRSENKVNTVNSVLLRRFEKAGDIVRVKRGLWGLKEWHPNIRFRSKGDDEDDAEPIKVEMMSDEEVKRILKS